MRCVLITVLQCYTRGSYCSFAGVQDRLAAHENTVLLKVFHHTPSTPGVEACDRPSKLSQHYAGTAPGPLHAFGFEMGQYAIESETARFTSPEMCIARAQLGLCGAKPRAGGAGWAGRRLTSVTPDLV